VKVATEETQQGSMWLATPEQQYGLERKQPNKVANEKPAEA